MPGAEMLAPEDPTGGLPICSSCRAMLAGLMAEGSIVMPDGRRPRSVEEWQANHRRMARRVQNGYAQGAKRAGISTTCGDMHDAPRLHP